jgi:hypothetical protein
MPLTVSRAQVKERLGITDAASDSAIDNLLAQVLPALEYALDPRAMADPDPGLVATLDLGALEWTAGEFASQLLRAPGAAEEISVGGLTLTPPPRKLADPTGLRAQGLTRLTPWLRGDPAPWQGPRVSAGGGIDEEDEP